MKDDRIDVYTGYNDLIQVKMSIEAAQKMVGSATMSMDPDSLQNALQAVENAKNLLEDARGHSTGVDDEFLSKAGLLLSQAEHQVNEALE